MEQPFIQQTLDDFALDLGKGKGMTGSGCAAAMSSLMGSKLLLSVCKITHSKDSYSDVHEWINDQILLLEKSCDVLSALMGKDAGVVTDLLKGKEPGADLLEVPLSIVVESVSVLPIGIELFHKGYKVMRGDTATALSLLRAGAAAAMFIVKENLKVVPDANRFFADVVATQGDVVQLSRQVDDLVMRK